MRTEVLGKRKFAANITKDYSFRILDDTRKQFEINYKKKKLRFQLKIKRAYTVIKELLKAYPNFINIHQLDGILNDPNRAHSDLRIGNGYANFLFEKRGKQRVMHLKLDVQKLFKYYGHYSSNKFISLAMPEYRSTLDTKQQDYIYKKFHGRCNVTGIKLYRKLENIHYFCKNLVTATYDHRIPVSKGGNDSQDNRQLISRLVNAEKNKICNVCAKNTCERCALACPEKFNIIQANNQDISDITVKRIEK